MVSGNGKEACGNSIRSTWFVDHWVVSPKEPGETGSIVIMKRMDRPNGLRRGREIGPKEDQRRALVLLLDAALYKPVLLHLVGLLHNRFMAVSQDCWFCRTTQARG